MALASLYKVTTKAGFAIYLAGTCEGDALDFCKHNKVAYTTVECVGRLANLNLYIDEDGIFDDLKPILPVSEQRHH